MTLRTVILGLGKHAKETYFPGLIRSSLLEPVALFENHNTRRENTGEQQAYRKKYGLSFYDDLSKLINEESFDIAIVTPPYHTDMSMLKPLIEAGKHIIKHPPFAANMPDALSLLSALQENEVKLKTLDLYYHPVRQVLPHLIKVIGDIWHIQGSYTVRNTGYDLGSTATILDEDWRADMQLESGGALQHLGYYFTDLLINYFGLPSAVSAYMAGSYCSRKDADTEEHVNVMFSYSPSEDTEHTRFPCRVTGHFLLSWGDHSSQDNLRITGSGGSIYLSSDLLQGFDSYHNEFFRLQQTDNILQSRMNIQAQANSMMHMMQAEQIDTLAYEISGSHIGMTDIKDLQKVAFIESAYESNFSGKSCDPHSFLDTIT